MAVTVAEVRSLAQAQRPKAIEHKMQRTWCRVRTHLDKEAGATELRNNYIVEQEAAHEGPGLRAIIQRVDNPRTARPAVELPYRCGPSRFSADRRYGERLRNHHCRSASSLRNERSCFTGILTGWRLEIHHRKYRSHGGTHRVENLDARCVAIVIS